MRRFLDDVVIILAGSDHVIVYAGDAAVGKGVDCGGVVRRLRDEIGGRGGGSEFYGEWRVE